MLSLSTILDHDEPSGGKIWKVIMIFQHYLEWKIIKMTAFSFQCIRARYVYMQGNYVYMQDDYVYMWDNHVYMQDNYAWMQ